MLDALRAVSDRRKSLLCALLALAPLPRVAEKNLSRASRSQIYRSFLLRFVDGQ